MKKELVVFVVLLISVSGVHAGLFSDSVWDAWLSGDLVLSNKDLAVTDIVFDAGKKEVLATVCNTGSIGVNFNNLRLAVMRVPNMRPGATQFTVTAGASATATRSTNTSGRR